MENKRLQIDAELHKRLKLLAIKEDTTILDLTNRIIEEYLEAGESK